MLFRLAAQQLTYERARSGLTALAIAAVIATVLVLSGFESGLYQQARRVIYDRAANLFVIQEGVENFLAVRSSLPQMSRQNIEAIPGVKGVHPIASLPIIYTNNNIMTPINMLVYDTLGGPVKLLRGEHIEAPSDIVIDRALAVTYGLNVGDDMELFDFDFKVSGITSNSSAFLMPFVFISYDGLLDVIFTSDIAPDISLFPLVSFFLVTLEKDSYRDAVADTINNEIEDISAITPEELAGNDESMIKSMLGTVISVMLYISYIVGALVVSLIIYADVKMRLESFAIMKALGFRSIHVTAVVVAKVYILLLASFPIGIILAVAIAYFIEAVDPLYLVPVIEIKQLSKAFGTAVVFSLVGGLLPLRMLAKADPASAFKGA